VTRKPLTVVLIWSTHNAGTVGIGTTNPGRLLTVHGDAGITTLYGNSTSLVANDWLKLGPGSNGNFFIDSIGTGGLAQTIIGFNTTKTAGTNGVFSVYNNSTDRNLLFSAQSAGTGSGSNQVIFPTGNVGIGTASPTSRLHVYGGNNLTTGTYINTLITGSQTTANSGEYVGFDVNPYYTATGTLNLMYGSTSYPFNNGSGTVNAMYGHAVEPLNLGSGNVGAMMGIANTPGNYGSGSIGSLYGEYAALLNLGTGTVTNAYSLFVDNPLKGSSATISNNYGIYIANQTAATNNYSLYSEGGTNFFGGNVGIGTAPAAGNKLDVAGNINASGTINAVSGLNINGSPVTSSQWSTSDSNIDYATAGNVGIGNPNPGSKLDVTGNINASGTINAMAGLNINGSPVTSSQWSTTGTTINYNTGNVGIGNPNPGSKLDVTGNINASGTTNAMAGLNINGSPVTSSQWTTSGSNINYATAGNVGIGTASPGSKLDVTGNTNITGDLNVTGHINARYQDVAEWVPTTAQLPAGTVVVLDSTKSNQVISSTQAYDTRVAGVVSEQPGITLGEGHSSYTFSNPRHAASSQLRK
jgi:hypothetical protein